MKSDYIESFVKNKVYDVRISNNGRWIDQKCTYDVVNFVADCIEYYLDNGGLEPFESPAIWRSDYAVQFVQDAFGKPYPLDEAPHDEFNKFFRQPMKMLAAAGVLCETGTVGKTIQFSVADRGMLEYLSLRPFNALQFLQVYIEKTLRDSGLWDDFERFFDLETQDSFTDAKTAFERFCYVNTPIRNKAETGRIFAKVLNPLAVKYKKRGAVRGRMSSSVLTLSEATYNRTNWRDKASNKDKNVARRSFKSVMGDEKVTADYLTRKAMRLIKQFNKEYRGSKSEVVDVYGLGEPATQAHHIFPKHQFPDIADYVENLIMLTSGQHFERAHPNGNTQLISPEYQYLCLRSKLNSIKENIQNDSGIPVIYEFGRLLEMLDCGFSTDYFAEIDLNDFSEIEEGIVIQYPPLITSNCSLANSSVGANVGFGKRNSRSDC